MLSYHLNIFLKIKELWNQHDKGKAAFYFFVDKSGDYGSLIEIDGKELWRLGVHGDEYRDEPSVGAAAIGHHARARRQKFLTRSSRRGAGCAAISSPTGSSRRRYSSPATACISMRPRAGSA